MMPEVSFDYITGIKKFSSPRELRLYLRALLESYQMSRDNIDSVTGDMIRGGGEESAQSKGWFKVGSMFANKSDPNRAGLDILFQIIKEAKPKIQAVEASLKTLDKMEETMIPVDATLMLYLRDGVPERIVIGGEAKEEKPEDSASQPA